MGTGGDPDDVEGIDWGRMGTVRGMMGGEGRFTESVVVMVAVEGFIELFDTRMRLEALGSRYGMGTVVRRG